MRLFYFDSGHHPKEGQKIFNQDDTQGALSLSLNETVVRLNDWCNKGFAKSSSYIVEIEVDNTDLVNGLNAAMVGNVHTRINGEVIRVYEPNYNRSTNKWEVII